MARWPRLPRRERHGPHTRDDLPPRIPLLNRPGPDLRCREIQRRRLHQRPRLRSGRLDSHRRLSVRLQCILHRPTRRRLPPDDGPDRVQPGPHTGPAAAQSAYRPSRTLCASGRNVTASDCVIRRTDLYDGNVRRYEYDGPPRLSLKSTLGIVTHYKFGGLGHACENWTYLDATLLIMEFFGHATLDGGYSYVVDRTSCDKFLMEPE
jgi:hypothetical protein